MDKHKTNLILDIEEKINQFKRQHSEGFTPSEIDLILLDFPHINRDDVYQALSTHTRLMIDDTDIYYSYDLSITLYYLNIGSKYPYLLL